MSTADLDTEREQLRAKLTTVLAPFAGRSIDEALLDEMASVLNDQLVLLLDGRSIKLARNTSGIHVEVTSDDGRARINLEALRAALLSDEGLVSVAHKSGS